MDIFKGIKFVGNLGKKAGDLATSFIMPEKLQEALRGSAFLSQEDYRKQKVQGLRPTDLQAGGAALQGVLNVASLIPGAGAAKATLAETGILAGAKRGAIEGVKFGAPFGAASGLASGLQREKPSLKIVGDIFKGTAFGAVGGAVLGGVLGGISGGLSKKSGALHTEPPPQDPDTALARLQQAIKEAGPARKELTALQSAERSKRVGVASTLLEKGSGEGAFAKAKGALKGELVPNKPNFEAVRSKIGQEDISTLADQIKNHPTFTTFEKINAYDGFTQLLNGEIPQPQKLSLIEEVFGKDLVDNALQHRTGLEKAKYIFQQAVNLPRSVMSSFDLSFGGRQGLFAAPSFRKEFADSWVRQFKMFGSEKAYQDVMAEVAANPNFLLAKESGLSFTNLGSRVAGREERFATQWGDYIPGVKQSGRAYTGFANKFRMDIFSSLARDAAALGKPLQQDKALAQEVAKFVNTITGRGPLGPLERSAPALNGFFFSPRLMASRIALLNPVNYVTASPFVRKQMITSLAGFAGYVTTVLTLSKLAGLDVGTDMRSADFGKVKVGATRFDIMGGFQQYIRMFAQLVTGQYVSTTTGKKITLGEGYKPITRLDILARQVESKEAPIFSFVTDLLRQQDYTGKKINIPKEIISRFIPMFLTDMYDIAKSNPKLLPWGPLGLFGIGIQTYSQNKKRNVFAH